MYAVIVSLLDSQDLQIVSGGSRKISLLSFMSFFQWMQCYRFKWSFVSFL